MPPTATPGSISSFDAGPAGADLPLSPRNFNLIRTLALEKAGISLADHKRNMVYRRLSRRVAALGFKDFDEYCALLASPEAEPEIQHMVNALTTNKTDFFRENHHFEHLASAAIPAILGSGMAKSKRLRIWSAGCSSGQEPYSIAMTLMRAVPDFADFDARILATDIDTDILVRAERGIYAAHELAAIPHILRNIHFQPAPGQPNHFRAQAPLRGLIAFRPLNLHDAWPMKGSFDAIFCRNVVIYFDKPTQSRLFDRFADSLSPGGFLYIGHSESLFRVTERFRSAGQSIYRKIRMTEEQVYGVHKRVKVLVIDDSALMRKVLTELLGADPEIEVVGAAADPLVARGMIKKLDPDVLTLDIEMPKLDGLAFLERLMRLRPMPVVMVSALTQEGAETTLQALEMGAVDFVPKPALDIAQGFAAMQEEMVAKVKSAARAIVHGRRAAQPRAPRPPRSKSAFRGSNRIVAIGASTGGVAALRDVLAALPADGPPILIAQHMPPGFTKLFARRLDGLCAMRVSEAADAARIIPGHVYVAPGDRHLAISKSGGFYQCRLSDGALVNGHMPSVDVLFDSCAAEAGADAVGLLMTGMGKDGAEGLRRMRAAGAATACQDEATCLIYGMPKAAMAIGAAEREISLDAIPAYILQQTRAGKRPKDVKAS